MSQSQAMRYGWNQLPWKKIQVKVFKLQRRIYRASQCGNVKLLHRLQRLLIKSWYARLLAVRRVTQDNRGRRTAGVDGVSCLPPVQRLNLAHSLREIPTASPLRRVWIAKPGTVEQRPLGIPVMADRAAQALVKLALEPEWEAKFEPNCYGYRPGRSCHDAIEAIFISIGRKPKYVVDADVAGCFDQISHQALLDKLNTYPALLRVIKTWLKCGILESELLQPTTAGTPQGGIISPLLANVALHSLETHLNTLFPKKRIKDENQEYHTNGVQTIRFADDFVVLSDIDNTKAILDAVQSWLKDMGLELKSEKTHISHTLNGKGFEFLGFQIRQHEVGKYHSKQGFKTLITPSRKSQKRHTHELKRIIQAHKPVTQAALIDHLNPVIRGWSNYYSTVVSKAIYDVPRKLDRGIR